MEKYESLYVKAVEMNNILLRKGAVGYFWIVTSPEIGSIFETATCGFRPLSSSKFEELYGDDLGVKPQGLPELSFRGSINNRWRIYVDESMPKNILLMGCNDELEDQSHYGRMIIHNFII